MNRHILALVAGLVVVALLLGACAPQQTEAPAPTEPSSGGEQPTEAPAPEVTITIWHGYTETEEQVFSQTVNDFMEANPNITIELLAVPFDQLQSKFLTEVAAGGGPTLTTGPQDRMAAYHEAGLLATIPEDAAFFDELVPASIDGGRVGGELVGVPINSKVVAMYYNTSMIQTPPATFDELLDMAAESGLAITADWFHNYMWVSAFGAELFDENQVCVLDETGAADAFAYLKTVCESEGVTCDSNDGDMDILFRQGDAAFRFQGPWIAGDAINDLGIENVAVTHIPAIPDAGDPRPWNQSEMVQMNIDATAEEQDAAMAFIAYLVSADVQAEFLNQANWIPVNENVDTSSNPVVGGFLDQVPFSDPFPVVPELSATWDPMQSAVTSVLEEVSSPEDAATEACRLINTANNKE